MRLRKFTDTCTKSAAATTAGGQAVQPPPAWCHCSYPGHGEDQVSGGLGPLSRRTVGLHFSGQDYLKYLQSKLFTTLISTMNVLIWPRPRPRA